MNATITSTFLMQMESSYDAEPVLVRAHYAASRPFEMTMHFHMPDGSGNAWTFARELLIDGSRYLGMGDVEVWRKSRGAEHRVFMNLYAPSEACQLSARAKDIDKWCRMMTELVPIGSEADFFDLDSELSALLQ